MSESSITKANMLFRSGYYEEALDIYQKINQLDGVLYSSVTHNINLCKKKLGQIELFKSEILISKNPLNIDKKDEARVNTRRYFGSIRPKYDGNAEVNLEKSFIDMHGGVPLSIPQAESPKVSIVIPVYKGREYFENCLRSLAVNLHTEPSFEVIALDDCPEERVLWAIPQSGGLTKINNEKNLGFLLNCNKGASYARGEYICFLNSDTLVSSGWLTTLVEAYEHDNDIGLVGSMLLNNNGTIQDAGWRILQNGWGHPIGKNKRADNGLYTYKREVDCVTGACFIIKRDLFNKIGGFDPHFAPAFYEEFDMAFRLRRLGFKTVYQPRSRVAHLGSASYGAAKRDELSSRNHKKFCLRFNEIIKHQPISINDDLLIQEGDKKNKFILIIDFDLPQPDRHAGDVTMSKYIDAFLAKGLRIVFFPNNGGGDGLYAERLEDKGIMIVKDKSFFESWIESTGAYLDYIFIARPNLTSELLPMLRRYADAKVIYYTHDLHYLRLEREGEINKNNSVLQEAKKIKEVELSVFREVDLILSPSKTESELIKNWTDKPVQTILPYFFRDEEVIVRDSNHFSSRNDIVFVGGFPHTPNVDAATFIVYEIMPLVWKVSPEVKLYLVGYAPPPEVMNLASDRVIVTGQVLDLTPYYELAKVVLCALRYGAGVKGKTVEALKMGVPVVGTEIAFEGIPVENNRNAIIRNEPFEMAEEILKLIGDNTRCELISKEGVNLIKNYFSENSVASQLNQIFEI